jgi:hypothetical protein
MKPLTIVAHTLLFPTSNPFSRSLPESGDSSSDGGRLDPYAAFC